MSQKIFTDQKDRPVIQQTQIAGYPALKSGLDNGRFFYTLLQSVGAISLIGLALVLPAITAHANAFTTHNVVAIIIQSGPKTFAATPRLKPAAPDPNYLTSNDYDTLKKIISGVSRKSWSSVKTNLTKLQDPDAKSLGMWYYLDGRDPNVSLNTGIAFLDAHPTWPSLRRIQRHLEKRISQNTAPQTIYNLFKTRDPISGDGKIQFIRALIARGDTEAAKIYLRDNWSAHRFSSRQERTILTQYGKYLTQRDHTARVDNLLWARQVTNSRRTFPLLSAKERRKAEVRAAFYVRARNAPRLYSALPKVDRNDPGVLHAAIRYYRRSDNENKAIELVRQLPDDPTLLRNPNRFWNERNLLMRWALKNGQFSDAYDMAHKHGLEDGLELADAEFNAGWVALRFLNEPTRAEDHFLALASWATSPISTARAYYWLGRAAKNKNDTDLANARFRIAAKFIYTYYGQLAAEEIGGIWSEQKFVSTATSTQEDQALFDAHPSATAFKMISDLGNSRSLRIFSYNLDDQLKTAGEYIILSDITAAERAPHLTIRAGKTAVRKQAFIPEISYPLLNVPEKAQTFVPAELIMGLSRQESEFNPTAFSGAGARGVMQLLPATAQLTARKEKLRYSRSSLLSDPDYNITIGSAHLSHLIERFRGSYIMTFVGYNAGPHRATRWVREYGDPRLDEVDPIDWVELIPFSETRNYVQRVLENTQIYRSRLSGDAIAGTLSANLEQGGKNNRAGRINPPSSTLMKLRPTSDKRPLPPLSLRTFERLKNASLNAPAARPRVDHLAPKTAPKTLPQQKPKNPARNGAEVVTTPSAPPPEGPQKQIAPAPNTQTINVQPSLPKSAPGETVEQETEQAALTPQTSTQQTVQQLPSLKTPKPNSVSPNINGDNPITATPSDNNADSDIEAIPPSLKPTLAQETAFDPYTAKIPSNNLENAQASTIQDTTASIDENEECQAYRNFVAKHTKNKNKSAKDLNAAMLAELRGQEACKKKPVEPEQEETP